KIRHENRASRAWSSWAAAIVRRRWLAAGAALVLLGLLVAPVFGIRIGQASTDSLASSGPAYTALHTLRAGGVPAGVVSPLEVLVDGSDPAGSAQAVAAQARQVPGVSGAFVPDDQHWHSGGTALVAVIPTDETVDSDNAAIVNSI